LSGDVSITVNNAATRALVTGSATYATSNATLASVNGTTTGSGGTVVVNGQSITVTGSDTVQTLINKINNLASVTGVGADFSAANGSGVIVLTQQTYGGNYTIVESESNTLIAGTTGTNVSGLNATVTVAAQALINGIATTTTVSFSGGRSSHDSGLRVSDTAGNSILLTETGNSAGTAATVARVTAASLQFQVGGNSGQYVLTSLGNVTSSNLGNTSVPGLTLRQVDVTSATGANNTMTALDEAIGQVSVLRAQLGSFQKNTLESTVRYLGIGVENLSASESQVRDTNVAEEVVKLTKNQILQQAGTSVLAQANSAPQQVLSLLR
jgi:flagellin